MHIKKQFKYSSVKAHLRLNKKIEDSFKKRSFGMGINKYFVRWYDGNSMIKDQKERDRWQLTRDMTDEKMNECKANEYEYLKRIYREENATTIKVLKITIYLLNENLMQQIIEKGLKKGVNWFFRQYKTPFRMNVVEVRQERIRTPPLFIILTFSKDNFEWKTPLNRIFPKLEGIIKYQGQS